MGPVAIPSLVGAVQINRVRGISSITFVSASRKYYFASLYIITAGEDHPDWTSLPGVFVRQNEINRENNVDVTWEALVT